MNDGDVLFLEAVCSEFFLKQKPACTRELVILLDVYHAVEKEVNNLAVFFLNLGMKI